jgi:hypothetical protein
LLTGVLPKALIATNVPDYGKVLLTIIFGSARCAADRQKVLSNDCREAVLAADGKNLPGSSAQSAAFKKVKAARAFALRRL